MAKFTNDYSIIKDILKTEYTLVLSLLFNNFDDAIHLLKTKMPFQGEILEYLYLSTPTYYNSTHDKICSSFRYIDNMIRILYKNHKKKLCAQIKQDVKNTCVNFHIEDNEFDYYYFIAMVIIALESYINTDAYNLYSEFSADVKENVDSFVNDLLNSFSVEEFQCLFYNHLEDVYQTNSSEDKSVSLIYKDNYSYFFF